VTPAPQLPKVNNIRNVVASWGAFGISAVAGLVVSPFVVRTLGVSSYGVWIIIGSLTGSLNFLDLGVRSAVIRFVAREHARGNHEAASRIAATARLLLLCAGVAAVLIGGILAAGLGRWFNVPPNLVFTGRLVLLLSVLTFALVLSNGVNGGILSGLQRLDIVGATDAGMELLRIALTVTVLGLDGGLVGLVLVGLLVTLIRNSIYLRAVRRNYPELSVTLRRPLRQDLEAIVSVSAYSTLIYSAVNMTSQAHTLIVAAFLSPQMVAYFAIGGTLPSYAAGLSRPIAQTVHPRASRLEALGDAEGLKALVLDTCRYSNLVVLPMVLTFVIRGGTFLSIWMGEEFRGAAGPVLSILAGGLVLNGGRHVVQAAFVGSGRHKSLAPWYLGEAAVIVLSALWAVPRFGIVGAAWAAVVPRTLLTLGVLPVLVRATFAISPVTLWKRAWGQPILTMLPFALVSAWVDVQWPVYSYALFFSQVALVLPIAILGAWTLGLQSHERTYLRQAVYLRLARRLP